MLKTMVDDMNEMKQKNELLKQRLFQSYRSSSELLKDKAVWEAESIAAAKTIQRLTESKNNNIPNFEKLRRKKGFKYNHCCRINKKFVADNATQRGGQII